MRKRYPGSVFIGKQIKLYRLAAGFTQERLAEKTGLSNFYISDLERGLCSISSPNLIRLAKTLKIQVGDLFPDVRKILI